MARRSKSRSTRNRNQIASQRLRSPSRPRHVTLSSFEDFRTWKPEVLDDRYPSSFPRPLARIRKPKLRTFIGGRPLAMSKLFAPVPTGMAFTAPDNVVLCVRRKIRKQVLHAFNKTGKAGQRKPRITDNSLIHC